MIKRQPSESREAIAEDHPTWQPLNNHCSWPDLLDIVKSTPSKIGEAMAEDHPSGDRTGNQAFLPVSKLSGFIRLRVSREIMHKVRFCEVL